jgi:RNA polymerase sigma factor (sigma-70 family)
MQNMKQVYEEHFNTVYKYLLCLTHNANFSEELTQETFLKALEHIDTFKGNCKISVWLCQIAKNLMINEQKKKDNTLLQVDETIEKIESTNNTENLAIKNEEKLRLYKKIQKLDKISKEVVYLRITGELSFKEIGNILNMTENYARVTFYRAKKKLEEVDENDKSKL